MKNKHKVRLKKLLAWLILSPLIIATSPFWIIFAFLWAIAHVLEWAADTVSL